MRRIAVRELRNNTSEVLREVEQGDQLVVTIAGRGVAKLVPLPRRPRFLPAHQLLAHQADPGLTDQLRELVPGTTDDMPDPWERYDQG